MLELPSIISPSDLSFPATWFLPGAENKPASDNASFTPLTAYQSTSSITHTLTLPPLQIKVALPSASVSTTSSRLFRKSFQRL